ncbi:MAG: recombination protein RecR [Alphaproteobacteria bacterium]|nr:recombination protein RecR [Alphaproteobacteria bacterium]
MFGTEIERLIQLLSRLPGLGPRSGRRAALALLKRKETLLLPLLEQLGRVAESIRSCRICGNLDSAETCAICRDPARENHSLCVVEDVADLWAIERSGAFKGRYHVLGGTLSALDGVGPDELSIGQLVARVKAGGVEEVILALNATVDGQTTAHYLSERLQGLGIGVSRLAHGVPIGGELDYLDDGTLATALKARRPAAG